MEQLFLGLIKAIDIICYFFSELNIVYFKLFKADVEVAARARARAREKYSLDRESDINVNIIDINKYRPQECLQLFYLIYNPNINTLKKIIIH
jgi:hypothetical protein